MSLKRINIAFKSLSSRLAFSYLLFFLVSTSLIFGVLVYLTEDFLEQKDHDIIEARYQQYQQLYERDGLSALQKINTDTTLRTQSARFLIYIKDPQGQPVFLHLPEEIENFVVADLEKALLNRPLPQKTTWFNVASADGDEDALEVRGARLDNGYYLHVGARTDSRDEIIERIIQIFTLMLLPFLGLAIWGAFFIAKRSLRPVRNLVDTVTKIKNGELSSRVPLHEAGDELYELGSLFNEMIERLEGLVNAMKDTLDNVAHDLKTPITRLKASGELALKSNNEAEIKNALVEAIENSEEIQKLIRTIMTVSEISANTARLQQEPFDLNQVISEVIEVYFFVAENKSISVRFVSVGSLMFEGDRVLIKQAIANLLDNALKYSSEGKDVSIVLLHEGRNAIIKIKDHGVGISESDLPRIWERLYRGDKSRHEPGLGLGLSLVKAIIEAHHGTITVESKLNEGSTFVITLPCFIAE